ncbi:MAG: winged helix-turn-helix transcriptional regulator [Christensenellaceae bacterium]|nr:winged helix-turn-helix transcriptional regulator [Christensenellaceae bacterium]
MPKYIESETLELKEKYTDSIAREIVSFLNASGGTILIGVKDNGEIVGVNKIDETLRKISDIITSQIEPNPQDEISSELRFDEGKTIIAINITKGSKNIYCQKKYGFSSAGCTIRIGTTCKEMTSEQIKIRYEKKFIDTEYMLKKKSSIADLTFRELKIYYVEKGYHLDDRSFEANLNLRTGDGDYNLLAELLADRNNIPFAFVKFNGKNKSAISERSEYGYGCLVTTYVKIKTRLQVENISISDTTVRPRKDIYLFDYDAINEAVINALVHNDWTITEPQISMYSDRIEIFSHGGLPRGMTEKQFFEGISRPRNTTLMRIFLMLGLTEHTGHGIPTIVNKYGRDVFEIDDSFIRCTIPFEKEVLSKTDTKHGEPKVQASLTKTEIKVLELLIENSDLIANELSEKAGVTVRTIYRALSSLQEKGYIERIGTKKNGKWIVIK